MIRTIGATRRGWTLPAAAVGVAFACAVAVAVPAPAAVAPAVAATDAPCFGAASRTPGAPCVNPALRRVVVPTPAQAQAVPDADCQVAFRSRALFVCAWGGVPADRAVRTVALIGDSHAAHWRPALEVVAAHQGWRVVSMSRAGCPLTAAAPKLPTRARSRACRRWNRAILRWLARHPEVSVVFAGQHRGHVLVPKGASEAAAVRAGYRGAWLRLLAGHVRHVIVLRDTPRATPGTRACVDRAIAARIPAGAVCAVPRRYALRPDPARGAAVALGHPRVQVADLSRVFCGARSCLPVIGGALVHRDTQHMTREFVRTLGPVLLRSVAGLMRRWRDPVRRAGDVRPAAVVHGVDRRRGRTSPLHPPGPA